MIYDDGSEEWDSNVYDTEEEAEDAQDEWMKGYYAGRDVLEEAGEDFCEEGIDHFETWEV